MAGYILTIGEKQVPVGINPDNSRFQVTSALDGIFVLAAALAQETQPQSGARGARLGKNSVAEVILDAHDQPVGTHQSEVKN